MPALPGPPEKSAEPPFDTFEYFQDKEDELDKPYNDRSYLSSEGLARDDARTGEPRGRQRGHGTSPRSLHDHLSPPPQSSWPC